MKVALFVPCYIDAFYPQVARATLELLEKFDLEVDYPLGQTCCGQPMANSGCQADAAGAEAHFTELFVGYDYIVTPSASCTHHVRDHFDAIPQTPAVKNVRRNTYELVEFLHDVIKADAFPWANFPHKVGLHNSCSALRGLKMASMSELNEPFFSKPLALLNKVKNIELIEPSRPDECCGFGGTFSVTEPAVSAQMGRDKVFDHFKAGAEYIVSADVSCLIHQQGCAERAKLPLKFRHIAQILNGDPA